MGLVWELLASGYGHLRAGNELTKGTVLKTQTPAAYNQSVVQFAFLQSGTFFDF